MTNEVSKPDVQALIEATQPPAQRQQAEVETVTPENPNAAKAGDVSGVRDDKDAKVAGTDDGAKPEDGASAVSYKMDDLLKSGATIELPDGQTHKAEHLFLTHKAIQTEKQSIAQQRKELEESRKANDEEIGALRKDAESLSVIGERLATQPILLALDAIKTKDPAMALAVEELLTNRFGYDRKDEMLGRYEKSEAERQAAADKAKAEAEAKAKEQEQGAKILEIDTRYRSNLDKRIGAKQDDKTWQRVKAFAPAAKLDLGESATIDDVFAKAHELAYPPAPTPVKEPIKRSPGHVERPQAGSRKQYTTRELEQRI